MTKIFKFVILASVILSCSAARSEDDQDESLFETSPTAADAAEYGKQFSAPNAEIKAQLDALSEEAKKQGWTFETGYTSVSGRPIEKITGSPPPNVSVEQAERQSELSKKLIALDLKENMAIASGSPKCDPRARKFSWQAKLRLPNIRDQGQCGSCWAFAAMGAVEISMLRQVTGQQDDTSEQHAINCAMTQAGKDAGDCKNGGRSEKVFEWLTFQRATNEKTLPYVGVDGPCAQQSPVPYSAITWGWVNPQQLQRPTVGEIKEAICEYGSVTASVTVTDAFANYRGGVFNEKSSAETNHAIVLVGWNDEKKAWLLRNSWGKAWGKRGYMWIRYDSNNVGSWPNWVKANSPNRIASQERLALLREYGLAEPQKEKADAAGPPPANTSNTTKKSESAGPHQVEAMNTIDGTWISDNGEATITIAGAEWQHPVKGVAVISKSDVDGTFEISYRAAQSISCSYRVYSIGGGSKLILDPVNRAQPSDYCPSGTFLRVDQE